MKTENRYLKRAWSLAGAQSLTKEGLFCVSPHFGVSRVLLEKLKRDIVFLKDAFTPQCLKIFGFVLHYWSTHNIFTKSIS